MLEAERVAADLDRPVRAPARHGRKAERSGSRSGVKRRTRPLLEHGRWQRRDPAQASRRNRARAVADVESDRHMVVIAGYVEAQARVGLPCLREAGVEIDEHAHPRAATRCRVEAAEVAAEVEQDIPLAGGVGERTSAE